MEQSVLTQRLSQYAAAWLGSFLLTLVLACAAVFLLGMPAAEAADLLLMVALPVLGLALVGGVILTFMQRAGAGTKIAVLLLAVVLALPLLWAPVLAVVIAAWFAGAAIEYSEVYAQFRITVSQLLYPLVSAVVSGAALRFVWDLFQIFGTVVGTIASAIQVWNFFKRMTSPRAAEA